MAKVLFKFFLTELVLHTKCRESWVRCNRLVNYLTGREKKYVIIFNVSLALSSASTGVDTNFEKLETVGLPTHNFQEPQIKFT